MKTWKKETLKRLWNEERVEQSIFHSLVILDNCLLTLVKNASTLINSESLIQFLKPWYGMKKYYFEILACLQSTISTNNNVTSKLEYKATLKAARVSKKIKYMDDPVIAEAVKITALKDQ